MATITDPTTIPENHAARVALVQAKNAEAQAAARVAAVDLCLSFRQLMTQDPNKAMAAAEAYAGQLAALGKTYAFLQQQARTFDALIGV